VVAGGELARRWRRPPIPRAGAGMTASAAPDPPTTPPGAAIADALPAELRVQRVVDPVLPAFLAPATVADEQQIQLRAQ
jgi:hypothetical protein